MRNLGAHGRLQQVARLHRIGEVIAERIGDRIRHDDAGGEMDDGVDLVLAQDALDERAVADIAFDERHVGGHGPAEAGRQVVDHDRLFAVVEKFEDHMAADITGAARDQNAHEIRLLSGTDQAMDLTFRFFWR